MALCLNRDSDYEKTGGFVRPPVFFVSYAVRSPGLQPGCLQATDPALKGGISKSACNTVAVTGRAMVERRGLTVSGKCSTVAPAKRGTDCMAVKNFKADDERAFMITTVSGTIYKLSSPDARGYRTIRRMMAGREKGGSVIMSKAGEAAMQEEQKQPQMKAYQPAHKTFFKGRLTEPVSREKQLTIEIFGENRTLISEAVSLIEITK